MAADRLALKQGQGGYARAFHLRLDPLPVPQDQAAIVPSADKGSAGQRQDRAHRTVVGARLAAGPSCRCIPNPDVATETTADELLSIS
jgi:hypothetical protein